MKEDYVSYPIALALKKAEFNELCQLYYTHEDAPDGAVWLTGDPRFPQDYNAPQEDDCPFARPICSAPTLWQAQKWLRKVHKIDLNVDLDDETDNPYTVEIYKNRACIVGHWELGFFTSYEQALSTGIAKALELIKKGE